MSFFSKIKQGLSKTSSTITQGLSAIFVKRKLDEDMLEELHDMLIMHDLGAAVTQRIIHKVRAQKYDKDVTINEVKVLIAKEIEGILTTCESDWLQALQRGAIPAVGGVSAAEIIDGAGATSAFGSADGAGNNDGNQDSLIKSHNISQSAQR